MAILFVDHLVPSLHLGPRGCPGSSPKPRRCEQRLYTRALLNLNHALARAGLDLIHACNDLASKVVERLGMWRILAFENRGLATVPGLTDIGIELDVSQEGNVELLGRFLRAAARKNIDLVIAVRAHKIAHVLDHAYEIYFHLAKHLDRLASIL